MQMKDNAIPIFDKWGNLYYQENDKLGGDSKNKDYGNQIGYVSYNGKYWEKRSKYYLENKLI